MFCSVSRPISTPVLKFTVINAWTEVTVYLRDWNHTNSCPHVKVSLWCEKWGTCFNTHTLIDNTLNQQGRTQRGSWESKFQFRLFGESIILGKIICSLCKFHIHTYPGLLSTTNFWVRACLNAQFCLLHETLFPSILTAGDSFPRYLQQDRINHTCSFNFLVMRLAGAILWNEHPDHLTSHHQTSVYGIILKNLRLLR